MDVKTIGLACDHAGFPLKQFVIQYLESKGYQYKDFGTYSDTSCDYPDFAHPLAEAVESGECYPGTSSSRLHSRAVATKEESRRYQ